MFFTSSLLYASPYFTLCNISLNWKRSYNFEIIRMPLHSVYLSNIGIVTKRVHTYKIPLLFPLS
jgi:hypothetical protein